MRMLPHSAIAGLDASNQCFGDDDFICWHGIETHLTNPSLIKKPEDSVWGPGHHCAAKRLSLNCFAAQTFKPLQQSPQATRPAVMIVERCLRQHRHCQHAMLPFRT
jgi:hypothetical protein